MISAQIEALALALLQGQLGAAAPWEIGEAVTALGQRVRGTIGRPAIEQIRLTVNALNKDKWFDLARQLCREWLEVCGYDFLLARHYAQALINLGHLDEAERVLVDALARAAQPLAEASLAQVKREMPELRGLLGRLYKQRAVVFKDRNWLDKAIEQYQAEYLGSPNRPYWHGINVVALMANAAREDGTDASAYTGYAKQIYADVTKKYKTHPGDPWLASTASEASLALNKLDQAELWLYRFIHHPQTRPFDLDSYARQLEEIWRLDAGPLGGSGRGGANLLRIMKQYLMRHGQLSLSPAQLHEMRASLSRDQARFEQNFSGERYFGFATMQKLLRSCEGVACVTDRSGAGLGTGFLVQGRSLSERFPDAPVLVTNAHVVGGAVPKSINVADARIRFEVESINAASPVFHEAAELLFTSAPGDMGQGEPFDDNLDVSVLALRSWPKDCVCLHVTEALPTIDARSKAYVVGHPRGAGLQVSINDSLLLDIDDSRKLVHYRTPTEPGSSGSPVFNANWDVMALHHGGSAQMPRLRGGGSYEANEGISMRAIRAGIARKGP